MRTHQASLSVFICHFGQKGYQLEKVQRLRLKRSRQLAILNTKILVQFNSTL